MFITLYVVHMNHDMFVVSLLSLLSGSCASIALICLARLLHSLPLFIACDIYFSSAHLCVQCVASIVLVLCLWNVR